MVAWPSPMPKPTGRYAKRIEIAARVMRAALQGPGWTPDPIRLSWRLIDHHEGLKLWLNRKKAISLSTWSWRCSLIWQFMMSLALLASERCWQRCSITVELAVVQIGQICRLHMMRYCHRAAKLRPLADRKAGAHRAASIALTGPPTGAVASLMPNFTAMR